ncbi:MAG: hypothetical protein WB699_12575 [Bacteroidota bacterium]
MNWNINHIWHVVSIGASLLLLVSGCKKDSPPLGPVVPEVEDTTSHAFTWQSAYVGDGYNSKLSDVIIIHDSLAYAIGEFYLKDSSGQIDYIHAYNLAMWDGHQWTPKRITYDGGPSGQQLYAICGLDERNVWLAGNGLFHWNGTFSYNVAEVEPVWGRVNMFALWVASPTSIYVGGDSNYTAQLQGSQWSRLTSGSGDRINDMWGTGSGTSAGVYYVAFNSWERPYASRVGRISPTGKVDSIPFPQIRTLYSIWSPDGATVYVCGEGVYRLQNNNQWTEINAGTNNPLTCIRGTALNDIFVVGVFGTLAHFNGVSWHFYNLSADVHLSSVAVKGNLVIAVGSQGSRGIALIARREQITHATDWRSSSGGGNACVQHAATRSHHSQRPGIAGRIRRRVVAHPA